MFNFKEYGKTKKGLIYNIYFDQKRNSLKRGHTPPDYTLGELREWCLSQPNFGQVFNNWVSSNYNRDKRPSIDRLCDSIGYSFNNIRITTWEENNRKGSQSLRKKVKATNIITKNEIFFNSISEASETLGGSVSCISKCCKNTRNRVGNYTYCYE